MPFSFNDYGYQNIAIWAAKNYGARADIYGSSDKTEAFMVHFDGKNYLTGNDAYVNIQGWKRSRASTYKNGTNPKVDLSYTGIDLVW